MEPKRILVRLTCSKLGDFLMATPTLAGLRDRYPNASITALITPPDPGEWLTQHPFLEAVLWDDRKGTTGGPIGALKMAALLRKGNYDAAIDLRDRARYAWLFRFAGIPIRIGSTTRYYGPLLTRNVAQDRDRPDRHEIEYNFDLARQIGVTGAPERMWLPISERAEEEARGLLRSAGATSHLPLILVNASHGGTSRSWPAERFAAVSQALAKTGGQIALIGGRESMETNRLIAQSLGRNTVDLTALTSVPVLAAVLKKSALHISIDTGTMHLAAAMETPCVALFPFQEHWEQRVRWQPWKTAFRAIGPTVRCPGCRPGKCVRKHNDCVDSITVEEVLTAARELL